MSLKPCKECKQEVSTKAKACPHCGAKNPTITGKDTAKGCLGFVVLFFVITAIVASCSDDTTKKEKTPTAKSKSLTDIKVIQITDINMQNKPSKSILFGQDGNNFCSITLFQSSIHNGYIGSLKNASSGDISANCNFKDNYLITTSKYPTYANITINNIDTSAKEATITVSLKVVSTKDISADNLSDKSYYTLPDTQLTIIGAQFTAFTQ